MIRRNVLRIKAFLAGIARKVKIKSGVGRTSELLSRVDTANKTAKAAQKVYAEAKTARAKCRSRTSRGSKGLSTDLRIASSASVGGGARPEEI
jgi:hypothetical protein